VAKPPRRRGRAGGRKEGEPRAATRAELGTAIGRVEGGPIGGLGDFRVNSHGKSPDPLASGLRSADRGSDRPRS
jgi:hypothetical protein